MTREEAIEFIDKLTKNIPTWKQQEDGMTKYKLYRHDAKMYKDWWVFPLAMQIHFNDMIYMNKNFAITVHLLCFHIRWLFMEIEDGNDD